MSSIEKVVKVLRALVTGGSGFIGSYLINHLHSLGYDVCALVRREASAHSLKASGCEVRVADLKERNMLTGLLDDVDYVFHLAGEITSINKKSMWLTNVIGTRNLLEEAVNKPIKKFIYSSSIGAMGTTGKITADEGVSMEIPSGDYYSITKHDAEKLCLKYHNENKVPVVILRIPAVYGRNNALIENFYGFIKAGIMPYLGDGSALLSWVNVLDLVRFMEECSRSVYGNGEVFIVCDDNPVKMKDYIDSICTMISGRKPFWTMPIWMLHFAAFTVEMSAKVLRKKPFLTRQFINFIDEDHVCSNKKACRVLGFRPSFEDSLAGISESIKETCSI